MGKWKKIFAQKGKLMIQNYGNYIYTAPNDFLMHHGIKGQKWGIRRYQNPDGTLTAEGRKRYGYSEYSQEKVYRDIKSKKDISYAAKPYVNALNELTQDITKTSNELTESRKKDLRIELNKSNEQIYKDFVKHFITNDLGFDNYTADKAVKQFDDKEFLEYILEENTFLTSGYPYSDKSTELYNKFKDLGDQYDTSIKGFTNEIIGQYGNNPISQGLFSKTYESDKWNGGQVKTASQRVRNVLLDNTTPVGRIYRHEEETTSPYATYYSFESDIHPRVREVENYIQDRFKKEYFD